MKKKANQDLLKEIRQLKQQIDALKSLCEQKTTENKSLNEKLNALERVHKPQQTASNDFVPGYDDIMSLVEGKQKAENYLNVAAEIIVSLNREGNITLLNDSGHKLLGYKPGELIGKNWFKTCLPEEDHPKVLRLFKKLLQGETSDVISGESQVITNSNARKTVYWYNRVLKDPNGNIAGTLSSGKDISDQKHLEQLIKLTKERYRIISETTSDFTFSCIKGAKGYEMDWMAGAVKRITGYSVEEIRTKKCWRFMVHPDDDPLFVKHVLSLKPGEESECELRIFNPKGTVKWLSVNTICFWDNDKQKHTIYGGCEDITEHKDSEIALLRTQITVDKSPLSVFWISPEGKFIYVNETAAEKLQYTREELLSMHVWDIDPNYPQETREEQFNLHREHGGRVIESKHRRSDGTVFPVKINAHVLTFKDQEMEIAEIEDITERKQAELVLKASETKFRSLFEEANDAILIMEEDVFVECNSKAEEIYGCKKELIIGKTPLDFSPELQPDGTDSSKLALGRIKAALSGENQFFEWHHNRFDDSSFYAEISLSAFQINDKIFTQAIVRDITERKESEKTKQVLFQIANEILLNFKLENFIRAIEKQLSQIVDTTNFYIALYDSESGMLSAPFEKDQKDSIESWPAKGSATGLVIEEKQAVLLNKLDVLTLIESGKIKQTGSICESWLGVPLFRGTDVSGVIVVQSYNNPEAFDSGTVELFEYVSNQISLALERAKIFEDLLHAKNRAEESDRLKSAFLANMSHEIRTPMNGILGFAELLKEPHLTNQQQQQYIEIIQKSGDRMLNIINDIVDISRIEAGLMDVTLKATNINDQLDYIYTFFKPEVEAKGMQLTLSDLLPEELAVTVTDREKLYAVLTNLVKNAIKFSHEGTIEFGCKIVETHGRASLQFYVKDTGIGIPKDRQQAIFERFIQADIEDIEARQGAGLGLAISKAYVEMLGGEIWVESEEGKGSVFCLTLPDITKPL